MIIEFRIRQGTVQPNGKQLFCKFKAWWHHGTATVNVFEWNPICDNINNNNTNNN